MSRLVEWVLASSLVVGALGCCAGPCRFYENAYGFNNPEMETYCPGPPPPVTTPPGYSTAVNPDELSRTLARPTTQQLPQSAMPSETEGPEVLPSPGMAPPTSLMPRRLADPAILPAAHWEPSEPAEEPQFAPGDFSAPAVLPPPRWVLE